MRGRDREPPLVLLGELLADLLEVFGILQYPLGDVQDRFPRLGDGDDALAVADENIDAEFFFQAADLLADARLRGMQYLGRAREVKVLAGNFATVRQLLQFHGLFFRKFVGLIRDSYLVLTE